MTRRSRAVSSTAMPRDAATRKKRPPGGRRVGRGEVERRHAVVETLLADGQPRHSIVEACTRQFGISARTTDDYIARVREAWAADAAIARPHRREEARSRLLRLRSTLQRAKAWASLVGVERLLVDIDGLHAPQQLDVRTVGIQPIEMTPEEAAEEIRTSYALVQLMEEEGLLLPSTSGPGTRGAHDTTTVTAWDGDTNAKA